MATKIVEQCQVAPPAGAPAEQLLKLLHMDMPFLCLPFSVKILFFYKLHCSESHFMDTIVPSLKNSLSLTLKHFLPMAGKVFIDNNSGMPVSQYVAGQDSVSLTIAVSYTDFVNLSGYHPRDTTQLHVLSPYLSDTFSMTSRLDVLAIQLTLFPNQGVCIGIAGNHAICDEANLILFINKWASINKLNRDDDDDDSSLPFYDRDLVKDGYQRAMECWRDVRPRLSHSVSSVSTATLNEHMLEATFVLGMPEIRKLKNLAIASKRVGLIRVSSFVLACAYLWSCMTKSAAIVGEEVDDDEADYFIFPVNCRGHLDPPLPDNYFGNCSTLVTTESTYGKLKGENGFLVAAEVISGAIEKTVGNGVDGSPKFYLDFADRLGEMVGKRMFSVAGSSGLDFYGTEFGWGRPVKFETLHSNELIVAFFSKSRQQGGIEICLSMSKVKLGAFAACFNQGITQATEKLWCKM